MNTIDEIVEYIRLRIERVISLHQMEAASELDMLLIMIGPWTKRTDAKAPESAEVVSLQERVSDLMSKNRELEEIMTCTDKEKIGHFLEEWERKQDDK